MFQPFEITVSFSLGKGEENLAKGGINDVRGKHGNEGAKAVKMQRSDDMPR